MPGRYGQWVDDIETRRRGDEKTRRGKRHPPVGWFLMKSRLLLFPSLSLNMVPDYLSVDVAWDIGDEDDDDGANGRETRDKVCVWCVCGRGCGRETTTYIPTLSPSHMGVGLKTTRGHRRTWDTARTHPRATTAHQRQPGPWESLDMPWAIGWGLGAFPGIPWDVFFLFSSLALYAFFQGPPLPPPSSKLPLFGRPGFGRVSRCPAAARGGG